MNKQQKITDISEALNALGVTDNTLTEAEKSSLDQDGFIIIPNVIDPAWLEQLRDLYETLMQKEGQSAGTEVHQEQGTRRLSDLVNKSEACDRIYTHPKVLAAVHYILRREFKLSSLNARDAIPGQGHQGLHADWGKREVKQPFHVVNSIWLVDDFTMDNGATRVVPGSHLLEGGPGDYMKSSGDDHPEQQVIVAPAGSVGIFNAHTWHGGTQNRTDTTRRALHCYYTAREHEQQLNQKEYIRLATYERISPAARYILDV